MGHRPNQGFFVIVFEGRTGSSYTVSCLNSHADVLCYPEVLAHKSAGLQKRVLHHIVQGGVAKVLGAGVNPRYFHALPDDTACFQAVGFKTKLQDVWHISRFYEFLHQHQFRLIYLKRHNVIKSALSMLNAHRLVGKFGTGHWNASRKEQVQGAFYVPPDALLTQLRVRIRLEKWHQQFFDLYDGRKMQLAYEDLLEEEDCFMLQLLNFLGVEHQPLKGRFLKNTPDKLQDAILNYDEIQHLFMNTYFERFLDDSLGDSCEAL